MTVSHQPLVNDALLTPLLSALEEVRRWATDALRQVDSYHGVLHAQAVANNIALLCNSSDIPLAKAEEIALRIAAWLHDVGYAQYSPNWSQDRREHVKAGLDFASRHLPQLRVFSQSPWLLSLVCYFIAHHDDINYQYPSMALQGEAKPVDLGNYADDLNQLEISLSAEERKRLHSLLNILVVADSLAATGDAGAERTFHYSLERGLPVFAQGNPLNAWCWEESAIGNVRLAAKRALISAFSSYSKLLAQKEYDQMEDFVEKICDQSNAIYCPETLAWMNISEDTTQDEIRLLSYLNWTTLEGILRKVELQGDRKLLPYSHARIALRRCAISDLRPTSFYVLESRLEEHRKLQARLQHDYVLSLFDLTGMLRYKQNDRSFLISPPIIETYYESEENAMITAIVDGLHRLWLARELGLSEVWVIEISDIPQQFPLVPLPLQWKDVRVVTSVPSPEHKRRFRFPSFEDFPDISNLTSVPVTAENYQYFFYRDLKELGSTGIRSAK
ncbi:MAG TPA: HD domain-containing protein [Ktedonobacteraceae bacterium]|nr:HD domain-containing protein [Ktedonobacteraceae bacterium]